MALFLFSIALVIAWEQALSEDISVPECYPPDFPQWGFYGPVQDSYEAGDHIHYYCNPFTHIGGNFYRRCNDNGDWTGDAPVCDEPGTFSSVGQTSTASPKHRNAAENAIDQMRDTCSSTQGNRGDMWTGILQSPGQLIRVTIFSPKGAGEYEVFMTRRNGEEISCGKRRKTDELNWMHHNCPEPKNTEAVSVKIVSLTSDPLELCEVLIFVLTVPTCVDPHLKIESGRLQLNRKKATLVCDSGYKKSPDTLLECMRNGVWKMKTLYCLEQPWEKPILAGPDSKDP